MRYTIATATAQLMTESLASVQLYWISFWLLLVSEWGQHESNLSIHIRYGIALSDNVYAHTWNWSAWLSVYGRHLLTPIFAFVQKLPSTTSCFPTLYIYNPTLLDAKSEATVRVNTCRFWNSICLPRFNYARTYRIWISHTNFINCLLLGWTGVFCIYRLFHDECPAVFAST